MTKRTLIIGGPTAVGKTGLGIKLAQKFSGEIISADSRQVYKHLDIGTGKDVGQAKFVDKTKDFCSQLPAKLGSGYTIGYYSFESVPIWLLDVIEPNQGFSVAEFVALARTVIDDIQSRHKRPLVIGGTGFYLTGLVDGYETMGIAPDERLRSRLEKLSLGQLQEKLRQNDPDRWRQLNRSDQRNPRRLIRAIEVAKAKVSGKELDFKSPDLGKKLFLALTAPRDKLYERIDHRIQDRLDQGMAEEVKSVLDRGYSWSDPGLNTLGYKQLGSFFKGQESLEEAVSHWRAAEHHYARQQQRWFSTDKRYQWFDVTKPEAFTKIQELVQGFFGDPAT